MSLFVCCGPFLSVTLVVYWPTLSESSVSYACNLLADFVRGLCVLCFLGALFLSGTLVVYRRND